MTKPSKTKRTSKSTVVEKPKTGSKPNALQQPLQPSKELAAVVGNEAIVTFWAAECCTIGRTTWRSACRLTGLAILGLKEAVSELPRLTTSESVGQHDKAHRASAWVSSAGAALTKASRRRICQSSR